MKNGTDHAPPNCQPANPKIPHSAAAPNCRRHSCACVSASSRWTSRGTTLGSGTARHFQKRGAVGQLTRAMVVPASSWRTVRLRCTCGSRVSVQVSQVASPSSKRQPGGLVCSARICCVTTRSKSGSGCPRVASEMEPCARSILTASNAGSRRIMLATVCTRQFGGEVSVAVFIVVPAIRSRLA